MNKEYPGFSATISLNFTSYRPRDWNKKQADAYLEWIKSAVDTRVSGLLDYFGVEWESPEPLLVLMGNKVSEAMADETFFHDGHLADSGWALSADMGLLVAKLVLESEPALKWDVVRRPKTCLSYNHPVIAPLDTLTGYFDPINVSIAEAASIGRGVPNPNAWLDSYRYCLEHVKRSPQ